MSKKNRYKYKIVTRIGRLEDWTGVFNGLETASKWYEKHGKMWEKMGKKLQLVKIKNANGGLFI